MHEDCGIVDNWHLSEALLGTEQHIEDGDDTHGDEATNHNIVLGHRVVLLPRSLKHRYLKKTYKIQEFSAKVIFIRKRLEDVFYMLTLSGSLCIIVAGSRPCATRRSGGGGHSLSHAFTHIFC